MACKVIGITNNIFAPKNHHFNGKSFFSYCLNIFPNVIKSKIICSSTTDRSFTGYTPSIWNEDFFRTLKGDTKFHQEDDYANMLEKVKHEVKDKIKDEGLDPLTVFKLIDEIQKLGLGDYFSEETNKALRRFVGNFTDLKLDLHATALGFRLLRQNGHFISQDVFKRFVDENGKFMSSLCNDNDGMISLYEASYLGFEGEHLLDEAKAFTKEHLTDHCKNQELPLRYKISKVKARHYIDTHPKNETSLLELARLDFNRTQLVYKQDVYELTRWWNDVVVSNKLSFARDRIVESYFLTIGMTPKLELSTCRIPVTKAIQLITVFDDIYDVYGTLDELVLFTKAIERWDIYTVDELPDYMKLAFLAAYNIVNEITYEILKLKGRNCFPYLKKTWVEMCKAFLVDAKWRHNSQTPTYEEYLDNGWLSITASIFLKHVYLFVSPEITPEALLCLENNHGLLRSTGMIFRICNDLSFPEGEIERGETNLAICYAKKESVSMKEALEHVRKLPDENWKRLNEIQVVNETPFSNDFIETSINLAATAQCIYQNGDGYGSPEFLKEMIDAIIFEPL